VPSIVIGLSTTNRIRIDQVIGQDIRLQLEGGCTANKIRVSSLMRAAFSAPHHRAATP
jgi:hypothetical protein